MDGDFAELTEVIDHFADGRTRKFIKTRINRSDVVALRAQAHAKNERAACEELLKDTRRLIERANAPKPEPRTLAPPEVGLMPIPRPAPAPAPQPKQPSPSPAVDRRSHAVRSSELRELALLARDLVALNRETRALRRRDNAQLLAAHEAEQAAVNADYAGRLIGKAVMLALINQVPPGHRASNVDKAMDERCQVALSCLQQQQYRGSDRPDFAPAFAKAWWLGCHEAFEEFNNGQQATEATG
jgi:hypothetical protein